MIISVSGLDGTAARGAATSACACASLDGASNIVRWSSNSYMALEWLPELCSHHTPCATCTGFTVNDGGGGGAAAFTSAGAAKLPTSASTRFFGARISAVF